MPLGTAEREVLFGTSVITYQMQLYLLKCPGGRADAREFRRVFADLSKAAFTSAVISLEMRGIITIDGEAVAIIPGKANIRGMILDRCWRAMHIERRFTVSSIAELTGYTPVQIREAIRRFMDQGALRIIFKAPFKPVVYEISKDAPMRPAAIRKRQAGSLVDKAWRFARGVEAFSFMDLSDSCGLSSRYAKEIIKAFRDAGAISEIGIAADGHTKIYRLSEDAPDEPPAVKNRARIKRRGY